MVGQILKYCANCSVFVDRKCRRNVKENAAKAETSIRDTTGTFAPGSLIFTFIWFSMLACTLCRSLAYGRLESPAEPISIVLRVKQERFDVKHT